MNYTNAPALTTIPFAQSATSTYRNAVPQTASSTPGAASYTTGFVPDNFLPIASGGIPPFGADFNGVLYDITLRQQYEQAGGNYAFSSAMSTAISGYPKGATVLRADGTGQWLNTTDGNTTDPDSTAAAGWIAMRANTGTASVSATSGTVSPTKTQLGAQVLIVTGTLTANAILSLPLIAGAQWTVVNSTTGAHTLTVAGATGSGVAVAQGTGVIAYTDGTNYYSITAAISGSYLPINGTAVAATKLATARAFNLTGPVTATGVNFDGTGNVTLTTAIADGALAIAKTSGLQAALDAKASLAGATFTGLVWNQSPNDTSYYNLLRFGPNDSGKALYLAVQNGAYKWINNGWYGTGSLQWLMPSGSMGLDYYGNLTATGSVTATGGFQVSDRRSKHDIELRPVDISIAAQLAPLWSQWHRNSDNGFDTGLIAQDVLRIAPQFVQVPKEPEKMLAIDKAGIALECALSAELRINQLLARIEQLEKAR